MKSFTEFLLEADLLPKDVPMYPTVGSGDKDVLDRLRNYVENLGKSSSFNKNSQRTISSGISTQKSNSSGSGQDGKDTPNLDLDQEKLGTHAIKYFMK
jgi:hypothetical protein